MMQGVVNLRREAMLTVVVGNSNRQLQAIDAVIDTGFNGFLSGDWVKTPHFRAAF
jgi:predicted aspartyl protease